MPGWADEQSNTHWSLIDIDYFNLDLYIIICIIKYKLSVLKDGSSVENISRCGRYNILDSIPKTMSNEKRARQKVTKWPLSVILAFLVPFFLKYKNIFAEMIMQTFLFLLLKYGIIFYINDLDNWNSLLYNIDVNDENRCDT